MAVNEKDYVKSDSKVKAAQSKLTLAKSDLDKVKGSNLPGAQQRAAEFQAQIDAAQKELDTASNNAKTYFAQNKDKIQTAADTKQAAKETKQKEQSAASIKNITESGYLSPEQIAGIQKEQFNAVKAPGAVVSNNPDTGSTTTLGNQVEDFASTLKGARAELKKMSPPVRLDLANRLIAAGFTTTPKTDVYTDQLLSSYQAAIGGAQSAYKLNKEFPTINSYLADRAVQTAAINAAGGGAGSSYTNTDIYSDPTLLKNYINTEFKNILGRDATSKEVNDLGKKLQAAQKAKPDRITTDANGNKRTERGVQAQSFLDTEIRNLPEYTKSITAKSEEGIAALETTARANGLDLNANFASQLPEWKKAIAQGADIKTYQTMIRNAARVHLPDSIKNTLDPSLDLNNLYSPYINSYAKTFGLDPKQVKISDVEPLALSDKGTLVPIYDFDKKKRSLPNWQYTPEAKTAVSDSVSTVLKDFGFMG